MEQFSLEKYLENLSRKVVTRDGREVEIFYYNADKTLLVGRISATEIHQYTKDGFQCDAINQAKNDLFFANEEEKLSEFESKLADLLVYNHPMDIESANSIAIRKSKILLEFARKEIREEQQEKLGTIEMPIDVTEPYYIKGKQDALKDLPKWRRDCFHNITSVVDGRLYYNDYYIDINELEKLPKEE